MTCCSLDTSCCSSCTCTNRASNPRTWFRASASCSFNCRSWPPTALSYIMEKGDTCNGLAGNASLSRGLTLKKLLKKFLAITHLLKLKHAHRTSRRNMLMTQASFIPATFPEAWTTPSHNACLQSLLSEVNAYVSASKSCCIPARTKQAIKTKPDTSSLLPYGTFNAQWGGPPQKRYPPAQ